MHHPPILFGAPWFQGICLENRIEFLKVLDGYKNIKAVIFGHAHLEYTYLLNNVTYIGAPSTWRQFNHDAKTFAYNDMPGGYNWYVLGANGRITFGTQYY